MTRANELNEGQYSAFKTIAEIKGVSTFAVTIAWHLHSSSSIIPIPGPTKVGSILDSVKGIEVLLTTEEMSQLEACLPENPGIPADLFAQPLYRSI